jgi:Lrp/AsnC family transcriptional regulator, cysteine-sensing transcriptional activator
MSELDAYDLKILDLLQADASLSTSELAERAGLSQSPCWRRVQRLREEGYIRRQVCVLDHEKLGSKMFVFSFLKTEALTDTKRTEFLNAIKRIPEITECYSVFGEMDVLIKVLAPDPSWFQDFAFSTLMKLPGVKDIRSTVTLQEFKYTTAIPLPPVRKG